MGSFIATGVKDTMEQTQRDMLLRQIELNACQIRERQMAMNLARQRDMFNFQAAGAAFFFPLLLAGAVRTKNPGLAMPILPLSVVLAYGNKMVRLRADADDDICSGGGGGGIEMADEDDIPPALPTPAEMLNKHQKEVPLVIRCPAREGTHVRPTSPAMQK